MVRPLDHVTVIQQMNFAEKVHQDRQLHPEVSNLQAEAIDKDKKIRKRRKTQATHKTERTRIHMRKEDRQSGGGEGGRKSAKGKPGEIDLKA